MKTLGRIFNIIFYTIFVGMLVGIAGLLLATMLPIPGKIELKIVKSGSMEPTIPTGSIVLVQPQAQYAIGDIITFGPDTKSEIPTTHRIIDYRMENGVEMIQTKGDANEEADPQLIMERDIIGKVMVHAPYVGFVIDFARQPLGFALLIAIPAGLVILEEVIVIAMEMRKMWGKKRDDDEDDVPSSKSSDSEAPDALRIVRTRMRKMDEIFRPKVVEVLYYGRSVADNGAYAIRYGLMSVLLGYLSVGGLSLLGGPAITLAYFSDIETSIGNMFRAGEWNQFGSFEDIVLNEFLPRPEGEAYGFDFGNDASSMPQGEWIELYNNGDLPVDVENWYMSDASGGGGNTHAVISDANTAPATTIIAPKSWLVVYLNKPTLNNTSDEIYLYTAGGVEVDFVSYGQSDACFYEPTPTDENSTTTPTGTPGNGNSGDCNEALVPPNKSYARIPDGIGSWVDPIPTPGGVNIPEPESVPALEVHSADEAPKATEPLATPEAQPEEATMDSAPEPAPAALPEDSEPDSEEESAQMVGIEPIDGSPSPAASASQEPPTQNASASQVQSLE